MLQFIVGRSGHVAEEVARTRTEHAMRFDEVTVSRLWVRQHLQAADVHAQIKRGIIRDFPTRYKDRFGNTVRVGFDVLSVLRDGQPEPFHIRYAANGVRVYIGRKDVILRPGTYTYTISYRTDRQLGFFKEYDELYWNVTGNGWTFPIERAEAVVQLPQGARILQHTAYTGFFGARGKDFVATAKRDSSMVNLDGYFHPGTHGVKK